MEKEMQDRILAALEKYELSQRRPRKRNKARGKNANKPDGRSEQTGGNLQGGDGADCNEMGAGPCRKLFSISLDSKTISAAGRH